MQLFTLPSADKGKLSCKAKKNKIYIVIRGIESVMNEYYRFIYQNVSDGLCCTGSLTNPGDGEEGMFHFLYVSGGSKKSESETEKTPVSGHYHLLIVADFAPLAVKRAMKALEYNQVDRVVCAALDEAERQELAEEYAGTGEFAEDEIFFVKDPAKCLKEKGITDVDSIGDTEVFRKGNRTFSIYSVGEGRERSLVLCHASKGGTPQRTECVMNVKPVTPSRNCSPFVDPGNLNCEMRCILHNDFTQCKKHNQRNGEYFLDAHLILGAAKPAQAIARVRKEAGDLWKRIRFVAMSEKGSETTWTDELLSAGTEGYARYFIGPEGTDAHIIRSVVEGDPYRSFVSTGGSAGLCVSGCYADR